MTAAGVDVLPEFVRALTPQARQRISVNPATIRRIRTACERLTPVELAQIVSKGIGWQQPANAEQLIAWRLAREAGDLDQPDDDTPALER